MDGRGDARAGIGFEKGRASFGILFGSKDAGVAQHLHDTSWEILAPLTAAGTAKRASGPGTAVTDMTELEMTDGMVVAMPKGTLHAWQPGGKKPLLAVQMYVPPGPEQRFKKLAADAAATAAGTTPTPTTTTKYQTPISMAGAIRATTNASSKLRHPTLMNNHISCTTKKSDSWVLLS